MKQKLLNLFTWRATLLVALLCSSFGSAWGVVDRTSTLTFSKVESNDQYSATQAPQGTANETVTWTVTSNISNRSFDNDNIAIKYGHNGSSLKYVKLSAADDINGIITGIKVNTWYSSSNDFSPKINVKVGGVAFGSEQSLTTSSTNFNFTGAAYCSGNTDNTILVSISNASGVKKSYIYVKEIVVTYKPCTVTLSENCYDLDENNKKTYYGTYSIPKAFVVPSDLTVHTVSVASGELSVTDYEAGAVVPANTGVMVSSVTAGEKTVNLTTANSTINTTNNMLRPTGSGIDNENTVMSGPDANTTYKFYYLTMNGSQIGFYRRNDRGSAFAMPANKAYLAVPENQTGNVKDFSFNDIVDGIKVVEATETENNAIYNLAGQRVSKMQKGIYVVNGKKMIRR